MRELDVYLHGQLAGRLRDADVGLRFDYDSAYLAAGLPPLSLSLETATPIHTGAATRNFFANLLPEKNLREEAARTLKVDRDDVLGTLSALGADMGGAVQVAARSAPPLAIHEPREDYLKLLPEDYLGFFGIALERPRLRNPSSR